MKGRAGLRLLASVLVTGGLSYALLRAVDVAEIAALVRRAHRPLLLGFVLLSFAGLLLRTLRYRRLLSEPVGFGKLCLVTAVRNFLVDLVPARAGSLSYVYLLNRRLGISIEPVLSSFVLAFVYDLLAMSALVAIALGLEFGRFEGASLLAALVVLLAAGSFVAFFLLGPVLEAAGGMFRRGLRAERAARLIEGIAREVGREAHGAEILWLLVLSIAIRVVKFGSFWLLLLAVLHERGISAAELPFWRVFLGIAGAELAGVLPVHGIAGFGTYEAAWTLGFTHLGLDRETAILSGFATHLLSQVYDYSVGLLALLAILAIPRTERS